MANPGNQPLSNSEYDSFLTEMSPFLKMGETLYGSIVDAGLAKHKTAIYDKYRLNDDFAEKIDLWRSFPGKLANNILVKRLMVVDEKIKQGLPVSEIEMKDVRFIAEKHRSAQNYFVSRQETVQAQSIETILDELDHQFDTDYNQLAEQARLQSDNSNNTPVNETTSQVVAT